VKSNVITFVMKFVSLLSIRETTKQFLVKGIVPPPPQKPQPKHLYLNTGMLISP